MKLPRPNRHVHGNFLITKDSRGDKEWLTARLVDGTQDLLRPLMKAEVRRVTDNGMVVQGTEVIPRTNGSKSNAEVYPQVWWVFVLTPRAIEQYQGDDPLEFLTEHEQLGEDSLARQADQAARERKAGAAGPKDSTPSGSAW